MIRTPLLLLVLPGALCLQAPAQDAPAAKTMGDLVHHLSSFQARPFQCNLVVDVKAEDGSFAGKGSIAWSDKTHFAVDFHGEGSDPSAGSETMALRLVADGSFLYFEGRQGDAGGEDAPPVQVMKVSVDLLEKLPQLIGAGMMGGPQGPGGDANKTLTALAGLKLTADETDSAFRYTGRLDSSVLESLGEETVDLRLELDRKHRFPKLVQLDGSAGQKIQFRADGLSFPEEFAAERFQYTAPEGAMVQDLTMIFQMMLQQAEQAAEDESDF